MPELADPRLVARVDILRVEAATWEEPSAWTDLPGERLATLAGAEAATVLRLIADLPPGLSRAGAAPRYAVRVHGAYGVLAEAILCFGCHAARTVVSNEPGGFGFDARSQPAQQLLAVFQRHDTQPPPIAP